MKKFFPFSCRSSFNFPRFPIWMMHFLGPPRTKHCSLSRRTKRVFCLRRVSEPGNKPLGGMFNWCTFPVFAERLAKSFPCFATRSLAFSLQVYNPCGILTVSYASSFGKPLGSSSLRPVTFSPQKVWSVSISIRNTNALLEHRPEPNG